MKDMIKRYFFFILGLIINSFGIAFITKSALGTSPISSVPYVFSLRFDGFSFGGFTFIMNMLFILLQVLLLRKNFQLIQLLHVRSVLAESFIYPAAAYQPGNRLRDPGLRHLRGSSP